MAEYMGELRRTHYCGDLRECNVGETVVVCGWVAKQRDLGQLIFIDLRDRTGVVQLAFNESTEKEIFDFIINPNNFDEEETHNEDGSVNKEGIVLCFEENFIFIINLFASIYSHKNIYIVTEEQKIKDLNIDYSILQFLQKNKRCYLSRCLILYNIGFERHRQWLQL